MARPVPARFRLALMCVSLVAAACPEAEGAPRVLPDDTEEGVLPPLRPDGGPTSPPVTNDAGQPLPPAQADAGQTPQDAGPPAVPDAGTPEGQCGNGLIEGAEACDGATLSGVGCRDLGFGGGTLGCKDTCLDFDSAACTPLMPQALAAPGGSIILQGSLDANDPGWLRPTETCGAGPEERRFFEAFALVNDSAVLRSVDLDGTFAADGFLHLYTSAFQPRQPLVGCVTGNDNLGGQPNQSGLRDIAVPPGTRVVVVVSTAAPATALGAFSITVRTNGESGQCGNGVLETGELCDGPALGTATCSSLGFDGGALACNDDCLGFDDAACTRSDPTVATAIADAGRSIGLTGSLDATDATWTRPSAACAAGANPRRLYDALRIVNRTGAPQLLRVTATWTGDGFLHVFREPFSALDPETNCVVGNDDHEGLTGSQLEDVRIAADEVLVIVASSFREADAIGPYTIDVYTQTPAQCGDGIREGAEVCDGLDVENESCFFAGFSGGRMGCSADCTELDTRDCHNLPGAVDIAARGQDVVLSGALEAGLPRWSAPTLECETGPGSSQLFEVHRIRNQTGRTQSLSIESDWTGDGVLHVFTAFFNSAYPTTGCRRGGDELGNPLRSTVEDMEIANGQILTIVASTAGPQSTGAYAIRVTTLGEEEARPIGAPGTAIQFSGSLDASDPTWNRLFEGCGAANNPNRHYDVHRIVNRTGVTQDLTVTANWQEGDGFLHLVTSFFDLENPAADECLRGDDDFGSQEVSLGSRIESSLLDDSNNVYILPDEELWVIASTFAAGAAIGPYTIEVFTGATDASPPTPAALAAPGESIRTEGTLHVTDARWTIPTGCGADVPGATSRAFDVIALVNDDALSHDVRITADWRGGSGHLSLYWSDSFDPGDPGLCLSASAATPGIIEDFMLAGESLVVVATSIDAAPLGDYDLVIETLP